MFYFFYDKKVFAIFLNASCKCILIFEYILSEHISKKSEMPCKNLKKQLAFH